MNHSLEIELRRKVADARLALEEAERALVAFESTPEFHTYPDLDTALGKLEYSFQQQAFEDCQGAHNCGDVEYSQEFIVDGAHYMAKMSFEYNRHDKMYYYIDGSEFSYEEIK